MKKLILFTFITIAIISCKTDRKNTLPNISGKAGELVLVIDNELWKSETGLLLDSIFKQSQKGLPQEEPVLDLVRIPEEAFSKIFKVHRNIIFVKQDAKSNQSTIEIKKDVWANKQLVINIQASTPERLIRTINNNSEKLINSVVEIEQERIVENYKNYSENKIVERIQKKFQINLPIPKGYTFGIDTTDFIWISHETPYISQGIFVYTYDYLDSKNFQKENLITKRNEFLKKYVAGPTKGSYMITELDVDIIMEEININKKYVAVINGLWCLEGDFMGGPFVSYSTLNKDQTKIIVVEGYVYAPKFEKRNYLRQVQAIVHSITNK